MAAHFPNNGIRAEDLCKQKEMRHVQDKINIRFFQSNDNDLLSYLNNIVIILMLLLETFRLFVVIFQKKGPE